MQYAIDNDALCPHCSSPLSLESTGEKGYTDDECVCKETIMIFVCRNKDCKHCGEEIERSEVVDDSVIGLLTQCLIVGYYSQDGTVLARITDPDLAEKARVQAVQYALCTMKKAND